MGAPEEIKKLALGTAQFGLDYGVSNRRGIVPKAEVFEILKLAAANGIDTLDTAQAYGTSEAVIGEFIKSSGLNFRVITKLKDVAGKDTQASLRGSLEKTGIGRFYGVMMHSYGEHEGEQADYGALLKARDAGLALKTGFTLYHPEQIEKLLAEKVSFDLVQVPYSVVDRRFERVFPALRGAGVEVHARSVFLQGLLLMAPAEIPENLSGIRSKVERLGKYAAEKGVSLAALCAGYALSEPGVDKVVMGVDSLKSFAGNLDGLKAFFAADRSGLRAGLAGFSETDEKLILPQNWNKQLR